MTRDMDLIRTILLKVEEKCPPSEIVRFSTSDFPEYDWPTVWSHADMIEKRGLFDLVSQELGITSFSVGGLSWEGYDFLDSVRDETIWQKTKDAANSAGGWSFDLLKEIAKGLLKTQIKKHSGIEI